MIELVIILILSILSVFQFYVILDEVLLVSKRVKVSSMEMQEEDIKARLELLKFPKSSTSILPSEPASGRSTPKWTKLIKLLPSWFTMTMSLSFSK